MSDDDPAQPPHGLVRPIRTDRAGVAGPTPRAAGGPRWRRTSQGYYVPSSVTADVVEQRILEASVVVPTGCALTGWAALRWLGARWFEGGPAAARRPVTVVVGTHDIRPQRGIAVSGEGIGPRHIMRHRGVPITIPRYSVSFEMRYARSELDAGIVLSMACYDDLVSIAEVQDQLANQNGWTGVPRARKGVAWAAENHWSPAEVVMDHRWSADGRHARPLANRAVFDLAGRHVATPDLIDPAAGVFGQYDGRVHLDVAQRGDDVVTAERLTDVGLHGVTMTSADLPAPAAFAGRLDRAYERAAAAPGPPRWTIEPPPGWITTTSVEARRALTPSQKSRLLRYRAS